MIFIHTPLARRDIPIHLSFQHNFISTHTPLARRDDRTIFSLLALINFYSHAPCEAWPQRGLKLLFFLIFLLTRPLRGVTISPVPSITVVSISTHTPLARRDNSCCKIILTIYISTHTPLARRDYFYDCWRFNYSISTHTPLARRDCNVATSLSIDIISTHTPLARRDLLWLDIHWL